MHNLQFQITDELYDLAQRRATQSGFSSVEEYASEILTSDLQVGSEEYMHLFGPERLAHINAVIAKVDAGEKTYSQEDVDQIFRNRFSS